MFAIGCDIGSQSLKGILLDPSGAVVGQAAASYDTAHPHPGWAEQDPLAWRRALTDVVGRLRVARGLGPSEIGAIGLATQVDGLVAVDADAEPLHPAIIWLDRRASAEARTLAGASGLDVDEIRRITGLNLDASHVAPKIMWLRAVHPEVYRGAAGLLLPGSALVAWLTGERVVDHANASSTLLYDLTTRSWSPRMLAAADIEPGRLGDIRAAATVAGPLTGAAARALGLTTRTQVVVGTGDEHGATLGAGGVPGVVVDITGTAEPVCVASSTPQIDETGLVETHGHADPRMWLMENPGFVSGGSVRWFLDAFGADGATAMTMDAAAVAGTVPGSDGVTFLPTLSGATAPRWVDTARGVYAGLSLNHGRAHLYRAVLEGCTFALRDIVDRLDALGLAGDELRVVGGGARSPFWLQMKADVTRRRVRVLTMNEATALGAAMLAGVGCGIFRDLDDAVDRLTVLEPKTYEPDPATAAAYDEAYGRYRAVFDAMEPRFVA